MSKGERNRIKLRVRTAMSSQTHLEGRYLGGRPPYGYTLKDLGPHPNPAKAADGKRLHGLTPDPSTAPVVQRIFSEFLAGNGLFVIAEGLTRDGIPCPSAHDRARNRHRSGIAWSKSAVRTILTNPRYTGRQVWNRQRTDEVLLDVADVAMGYTNVMRWNSQDRWVRSKTLAHTPLVDDDTFARAREILARRGTGKGGRHVEHRTRNTYVFRGAVRCAVCRRKMQGQYSHGVAYYRCRFPQEYALANRLDHPRNVYIREDAVIEPLDAWLAGLFAPHERDRTIAALADVSMPDIPNPALNQAQAMIAECDAKLERYRSALEAGADPSVVAAWIAQAQADRARAHADAARYAAGSRSDTRRMSREGITAIVNEIADAIAVLREADPADKAKLYRQLGVRLTYHPETQTVSVQAHVGRPPWGNGLCPRGDLNPHALCGH
ncbi:hypothetical protein GCM10009835_15790 [Planosporangium flavigriseum]